MTTDDRLKHMADDDAGDPAGDGQRGRRTAARVTTCLAGLLVLFALVAPIEVGHLTPGVLVRIPLEGLLGVALVLVLPPRARRVAAAIAGVVLGLLTIVKVIDMGFVAALARPFDPVSDWSFFGPAVDFLTGAIGRVGAIGSVVAAAVLAVAMVILMTLSVLHLARLAVGRRTTATRTVAVLGIIWIICAASGVQIVPGEPVASTSAAAAVYDDLRQVHADLQDRQSFANEVAADTFRNTPGEELLPALRGKDVVVAFVESYGRVAVQGSDIAPQVDAVLDAGTSRLRATGFTARSAFLTSPTFGGGSWLAHSTLESGVWINNQQRYNDLVAGTRLTLSGAFRRAGWRTVGDVPENTQDWPEGAFYGYSKIYDARNVGYHGPNFSYAAVPDQYTLAAFQRLERATPDHAPVMAEIDLVSSHSPWAPVPQLVNWNDVGDGSIFNPMPAAGTSPATVWPDPARVRIAYGNSIQYSLNTLISYLQAYGDNNLVLIFLGDHQPASIVSGEDAGHDVPITIVTRDPAVLNRISEWSWQDGLKPGPQAPVWPMNTFRDRFLTAFGP